MNGAKNLTARDFLVTRRAKITPEQAGLTLYGGNRRVPGLRREEVALLAGVSVDYYTRLEKGNLSGVSESVLDAIAAALQLDEYERTYLFDLARAANAAGRRGTRSPVRRRAHRIQPHVQLILDSISAPAFIRNGRLDILATNLLGRALYAPMFDSPTRTSEVQPPNIARFGYLDPTSGSFLGDPEYSANTSVKLLRAEAGRDPYDKELCDLIGELSTRSPDFRTRWAAHDVHELRSGTKTFNHPVVGDLDLSFEAMVLAADTGLTMTTYVAEPGSPSEERLQLLASWAATTLRATGTTTPRS